MQYEIQLLRHRHLMNIWRRVWNILFLHMYCLVPSETWFEHPYLLHSFGWNLKCFRDISVMLYLIVTSFCWIGLSPVNATAQLWHLHLFIPCRKNDPKMRNCSCGYWEIEVGTSFNKCRRCDWCASLYCCSEDAMFSAHQEAKVLKLHVFELCKNILNEGNRANKKEKNYMKKTCEYALPSPEGESAYSNLRSWWM